MNSSAEDGECKGLKTKLREIRSQTSFLQSIGTSGSRIIKRGKLPDYRFKILSMSSTRSVHPFLEFSLEPRQTRTPSPALIRLEHGLSPKRPGLLIRMFLRFISRIRTHRLVVPQMLVMTVQGPLRLSLQ